MIYWLTGQPGSGKTTLASWIQASFPVKSMIVDGDDIREIFVNKDYSEEGRRKNIERAQTLAKFLHHKGYTVIVSLEFTVIVPPNEELQPFVEPDV